MTQKTRITLTAVGVALLVLWAAWWGVALYRLRLPFAAKTWFVFPAFGADFWSQPEYAAREWFAGRDPYANENHLFHYPPLVIRLFLWTPHVSGHPALRIWILANIAVLVVAVVAAARIRPRLGLSSPPLVLLLALVLFSFPVVFELERSNFDLISLAALLVALPLLSRRARATDIAAGVLLAVAPWVKLYPGVIGLGLLALRRPWAVVGFGVGGIGIGLATPQETLDSFHIVNLAIQRVTKAAKAYELAEWTHSLSAAWIRMTLAAPTGAIRNALTAIPASPVAGVLVMATLVPVCYRVFRSRHTEALTYPLLLWMMAVASCAPIIANDYSLVFLPLATVAIWSRREPWHLQALLAMALIVYQPLHLPIPTPLGLALKLMSLVLIGVVITRRARELDGGAEQRRPSGDREGAAS